MHIKLRSSFEKIKKIRKHSAENGRYGIFKGLFIVECKNLGKDLVNTFAEFICSYYSIINILL